MPISARRRCARRPSIPRVIGIGETGLDYYYDNSDRAVQQALFRMHIAVARETGLPLIIHTRDAEDDTARDPRRRDGEGGLPGADPLLHRFGRFRPEGARPGPDDLAFGHRDFQECQGLAGIREGYSRDRLLVETDSPFLAPVPHRGKTCEPAYVRRHGASSWPDLRGDGIEDAGRKHHANFFRLFTEGGAREADHARLRHVDRRADGSATTGAIAIRTEPKNRRTRVSIMVESDEGSAHAGRYLARSAPAVARQRYRSVDAVFWTHDHADHCHGIDDLRPMRFGRDGADCRVLHRRDRPPAAPALRLCLCRAVWLSDDRRLEHARNLRMRRRFRRGSVEMPHGPMPDTAYRFEADGKSIGYATDFSEITDEMVDLFDGVDILVTDCLRREPHPTHAQSRHGARTCRARPAPDDRADASRQEHGLRDAVAPKCRTTCWSGFDGLEIDRMNRRHRWSRSWRLVGWLILALSAFRSHRVRHAKTMLDGADLGGDLRGMALVFGLVL